MPKIIILVGPSGCGKTAVMEQLVKYGEAKIIPSLTTRAPRPGGKEDNYIFVSRDEFKSLQKYGRLIEASTYAGNLYGTPMDAVEAILNENYHAVKAMDIQGAMAMRKLYGDQCMIVAVHRPPHLLIDAVSERDIPDAEKEMRIAYMSIENEKSIECCDVILRNDGDIEQLELMVKELIDKVQSW